MQKEERIIIIIGRGGTDEEVKPKRSDSCPRAEGRKKQKGRERSDWRRNRGVAAASRAVVRAFLFFFFFFSLSSPPFTASSPRRRHTDNATITWVTLVRTRDHHTPSSYTQEETPRLTLAGFTRQFEPRGFARCTRPYVKDEGSPLRQRARRTPSARHIASLYMFISVTRIDVKNGAETQFKHRQDIPFLGLFGRFFFTATKKQRRVIHREKREGFSFFGISFSCWNR